ATTIEAAQHLLPQPRDIVLGQIRTRRPGQHAARRERDLAPDAAQVGQRAIKHAVEKTSGGAVAHRGSAIGEAGYEAHTESRDRAPAFSARKAAGRLSTRSSATRPGPKRRAASACSHTAAAAASKAGMPCASRPVTIPASTSPEPAVANSGGAPSLMAARPSG